MRNPIKIILIALGVFQLLREIFFAIPFLGGSYILSTGWAPLATNILVYSAIVIILMLDKYNEAKSMLFIPSLGILFSALSFIPFLGWFLHCVLTLLMIVFVYIVINTRAHVGNTTKYNPYERRETVNDSSQYNRR
ncbi:hypothetical protein [Macrococcus sp. DPC7161]|uniref:hypothetical protein n=1 Tax=Macrococcus sp. DPC7161 TaxID=2507060 RepID=UPI00100BDFBE|nr:hypothetical protein [Macrococcus sp. DPC7161]RXK18663.1 hypothetical protein ER639_05170 [Macrococcus sp. DPC7161]